MALRPWAFAVLGVALAAVGISAATALGLGGFRDDPVEPSDLFQQPQGGEQIEFVNEVPSLDSLPKEVADNLTWSGYASSPRALTADECTAARPRMEAIAELAASRVAELKSDSEQGRLETALKESRAWFDAGCPAHEKLGIYPANDGSGTMNILIDF